MLCYLVKRKSFFCGGSEMEARKKMRKKLVSIILIMLLFASTTLSVANNINKLRNEQHPLTINNIKNPSKTTDIPVNCSDCMVGYWKFDDHGNIVMNDSIENPAYNHGQIIEDGEVPHPGWGSGKVNACLFFQGDSDDYVYIPHHDSLNFGTGNFALEAWISYTGPNDGSVMYPCIMSKRPGPEGSNPDEGFMLGLSYWSAATQGALIFRIGGNNYIGSNPVDDGGWHHIVVQRCGTEVQFYIDGILTDTATSNKDASSNGNLTFAVDRKSGFTTQWDGWFDEFAIYNCCLSAQTIKTHYENSQNGNDYCTGTVHNVDTNLWYNWIQDAIDDQNTESGDTIEVFTPNTNIHPSGEYVENVIVHKDDLKLKAIDSGVIINGASNTVTVNADGDVIQGFIIQNGDGGIRLNGNDATIKFNELKNNHKGIWIYESNDHSITENYIHNNEHGIWLYQATKNEIINNKINDNNKKGLHFESSTSNIVKLNWIICNEVGIALLHSSNENDIMDNVINNQIKGLSIVESNDNEIFCNNIMDNGERGVTIQTNSMGNCLFYNLFGKQGDWYSGSNDYWALWIDDCCEINEIYQNNFDYPAGDDNGNNYWDNGVEGNYWSWESGPDDDGDGILDMLHELYGNGESKDGCPLVALIAGGDCSRKLIINIEDDVNPNQIHMNSPYTYTYTITIENPFSFPVNDVYIVDFLPPGTLDIPSGTNPSIISRVNRGQHLCVITWYIPTLAVSSTYTIEVQVEIDTSSPHIIGNTLDLYNQVFAYSDETITSMTDTNTHYLSKNKHIISPFLELLWNLFQNYPNFLQLIQLLLQIH